MYLHHMPYTLEPQHRHKPGPSFHHLTRPVKTIFNQITPLNARGKRALQMTLEDQLNALIYFHLEEHDSGRHLLQALEEDDFARDHIVPQEGIKKSSFLRQSIPGGLYNCFRFFKSFSAKPLRCSPKNISTSAICVR